MRFVEAMMKKLGLVAIATLLLTGCASPATAVAVNDTRITERQVTEIAKGCAEIYENSADELRRDVVNNLLMGQLGTAVAADHGVQISAAERTKFLEGTTAGQLMLSNEHCATMADGLAMYLLTFDRVGQDAFIASSGSVAVKLNPRYGVWDATKITIAGSGSLSELAPNHQ